MKEVDLGAYYNKNSAGQVTALRDACDNLFCATKDLLEENIEVVRQHSATSVIMYIQDHGENLYDDERRLFQHIIVPPGRFEVTVPLLVWVSERFTEQFPDKWSNIVANAHRPVSNRQVPPNFVDWVSVVYDVPNFDNSLFADYTTDASRYVLGPKMKLLTRYEVE
jgi:glucan phosphoethanolaminetransferase (alkaline phosphatase superfamily)